MSGLLLGFSGKMASGKSTTAHNILAEIAQAENSFKGSDIQKDGSDKSKEDLDKQFKVISFADELRKEVSLLLSHATEVSSAGKYAQHEIFAQVDKRIAKKLYNFILSDQRNIRRTVMQVWGTDVRRASNENYWVEKAIGKAVLLNSQGINVALDDVRFKNEAVAILENDGLLVRLDISPKEQYRRLQEIRHKQVEETTLRHESETSLDDYPYFSLRVDNTDNKKAEEEIVNYISYKSGNVIFA